MTKLCNKCKIEKPRTKEFFYSDKRVKDGLQGQCKTCRDEDRAAYLMDNKEKANAASLACYYKNRDVYLANVRKWRAKNAERIKKTTKDYALRTKYNLTEEGYNALREAQGNRCAICHTPENELVRPNRTPLCVDHDHQTGEVRGLLCDSCNNGLGRFKDDIARLKSAIAYLGGM